MPDNPIPALPPGFKLDPDPIPALPPGFKLDPIPPAERRRKPPGAERHPLHSFFGTKGPGPGTALTFAATSIPIARGIEASAGGVAALTQVARDIAGLGAGAATQQIVEKALNKVGVPHWIARDIGAAAGIYGVGKISGRLEELKQAVEKGGGFSPGQILRGWKAVQATKAAKTAEKTLSIPEAPFELKHPPGEVPSRTEQGQLELRYERPAALTGKKPAPSLSDRVRAARSKAALQKEAIQKEPPTPIKERPVEPPLKPQHAQASSEQPPGFAPRSTRSQVIEASGAAKNMQLSSRFKGQGLTPQQVRDMPDAKFGEEMLAEGKQIADQRRAMGMKYKRPNAYDPYTGKPGQRPYNISKLETADQMEAEEMLSKGTLPKGNGKTIDTEHAQIFLRAARYNAEDARKLAASHGWMVK